MKKNVPRTRFPRLNAQTEALVRDKNLTNPKRLRRALTKLDMLERAGVDVYTAAKSM